MRDQNPDTVERLSAIANDECVHDQADVDTIRWAVREIEALRKRVLDLKRPPRGIGGQVVTVADGCPTYGDLLDAYYRTENEYADHFAKLWQRIKEQDEIIDRLTTTDPPLESGSGEADR